jgi:predicted cupin superfamily sugar epimerase
MIEVPTEAGARPLSTAILYLFTTDEPSRFHRLRWDEVWFYHAGSPAELVLLAPPMIKRIDEAPAAPGAGSDPRPFTTLVVGLDCPQALVPAYYWMAARVLAEDEADWGAGRAPERRWTADRRYAPESRWTLVSCVVSPGFQCADFELAERKALVRDFPQARAIIRALT